MEINNVLIDKRLLVMDKKLHPVNPIKSRNKLQEYNQIAG